MSSYPPPTNWTQSIFNPANWVSYNDALTVAMGNKKYLIKTGTDTDYGIANFSNQINLSNTGFRFINDLNSGIYLAGTSDVRIWVASFERLIIKNTLITSNPQFRITTGSLANPHLQFNASASAGIYSSSTTNLSFVANATDIVKFDYSATASSNGITIFNSALTNYNPTILSCYEEYSYSTTFGFVGFNQTISYTLKISRIGNRCFLYVPSWSAGVTNNSGGNALCITATAMAPRFWPLNGVSMIGFGYLSGTANLVWIFVNSVGNILIYKGVGVGNATWGNTEACRIEGFSIDWTV